MEAGTRVGPQLRVAAVVPWVRAVREQRAVPVPQRQAAVLRQIAGQAKHRTKNRQNMSCANDSAKRPMGQARETVSPR
jgi:hypothetical protein